MIRKKLLFKVILALTTIQILVFNGFMVFMLSGMERTPLWLKLSTDSFLLFSIVLAIFGGLKLRPWAISFGKVYLAGFVIFTILLVYNPRIFVKLTDGEKAMAITVSTLSIVFWMFSFWMFDKHPRSSDGQLSDRSNEEESEK